MAGTMNEFEWLQWFLVENFSGRIDTALNAIAAVNSNQIKTLERISLMEKNIQDKIEALSAGMTADAEAKAKVLGEIKATVEKLKAAQGTSQEAINAAVAAAKAAQAAEDKVAFDAANAEVVAALTSLQEAQTAGLELTKTLDAQVEDAPPAEPVVG
jgi:hypothetical protein